MEAIHSLNNPCIKNLKNYAKKKKVKDKYADTTLNTLYDSVMREITKNLNANTTLKSIPQNQQLIFNESNSLNHNVTFSTSKPSATIFPSILEELTAAPKKKSSQQLLLDAQKAYKKSK